MCVPSRQAQWRVISLDSGAIASSSHENLRIPEAIITTEVDSASSPHPVQTVSRVQALSQTIRDQSIQFENPASESDFVVGFLGNSHFDAVEDGDGILQSPSTSEWEDTAAHDETPFENNQIGAEGATSSRTATVEEPPRTLLSNNEAAATGSRVLLAKLPSLELHAQLWNVFIRHIATELTPLGTGLENPFLRYLATRARDDPPLFAAVLFLSQQIVHNMSLGTLTADTGKISSALGDLFEQEAIQEVRTLSSSSDQSSSSNLQRHLSITITLCTGYITQGNSEKLQEHLESAFLLAQALFKRCQGNETFLFLLKWLGYIHTTAMLSIGKYDVKTPDYISISTASQAIMKGRNSSNNDSGQAALHSLRGTAMLDSPAVLFSDIDSFLGISSDVCSILYKTGRMLRMRHAITHSKEASQWFWPDFEADVLDLDTRLEQQLTILQRNKGQGDLGHLDQYNSALVHTAHLIFQTDIRCVLAPQEVKTEEKIGTVLDFCANIPIDSQVARLSILPLFHAGLRSHRRIYRDFVLTRLSGLRDYYLVANVQQVIELLKNMWQNPSEEGKQ